MKEEQRGVLPFFFKNTEFLCLLILFSYSFWLKSNLKYIYVHRTTSSIYVVIYEPYIIYEYKIRKCFTLL